MEHFLTQWNNPLSCYYKTNAKHSQRVGKVHWCHWDALKQCQEHSWLKKSLYLPWRKMCFLLEAFFLHHQSISVFYTESRFSFHTCNKFLIATITEAISLPSLLHCYMLTVLLVHVCPCLSPCHSAVNYPAGLEQWFLKSSMWQRKHGTTTLTPSQVRKSCLFYGRADQFDAVANTASNPVSCCNKKSPTSNTPPL